MMTRLAIGLLAILTVTPVCAQAATLYHYTERDLIIGRMNRPGYGWSQWMCQTNGTTETWTQIGSNTTLYDHSIIASTYSGTSSTYIVFVNATSTRGTLYHGGCYGTWYPLLQGTKWITAESGPGNDVIIGGYGYCGIIGQVGNDVLWNYSIHSGGYAIGWSGDDTLIDVGGSSINDLQGNGGPGPGGIDCLWDGDGAASVFNCGGETGDKYVNNGVSHGGTCSVAVSTC